MSENKPVTRLQASILNKELQRQSKIAIYPLTLFVTSGMDTRIIDHNSDHGEMTNLNSDLKRVELMKYGKTR